MDIRSGSKTVTDNLELSAMSHMQRFRNYIWWQSRTTADDLLCSSDYSNAVVETSLLPVATVAYGLLLQCLFIVVVCYFGFLHQIIMDLILELWWLSSRWIGYFVFEDSGNHNWHFDITKSCLASLTVKMKLIHTAHVFPFEKDRLILLCNAIIGLSWLLSTLHAASIDCFV
jgi:hypothetical protein